LIGRLAGWLPLWLAGWLQLWLGWLAATVGRTLNLHELIHTNPN